MLEQTWSHEPSPADEARQCTRDHVRAVARLIDGDEVAIVRTTSFGAKLPDVEALSGLEAAVRVRDTAAGLVREYAIAARGEGACWASVGAALGLGELVDRSGEDLGEAAFRFVAQGRMPDLDAGWLTGWSSVSWTCATCGARVADHGPFASHPDDAQMGHAQECGRRQRAIARLRAPCVDDEDCAAGGVSGRW